MNRLQESFILRDLNKKMVFITGPRQVGKTWLANRVERHFKNTTYLNYDDFDDRLTIEQRTWYKDTDLLILDELHKMKRWKTYIKGVFDTKPTQLKIIITGSAKLDTFRQSGDSLSGRYFLHRLLPFSVKELEGSGVSTEHLFERGGFPEPLFSDNVVDAQRWRNQYKDSLIRQEVSDFSRVAEIRNLELVFELLRRRVGSPVSYNSIAQDLHLSAPTVKSYVDILESLFIVFRVTPYSRNIARSILKSPKVYFYDSGLVLGDDGARFENFVAVCLQKHAYAGTDYTGIENSLNYIRTKDGREVDFCLAKENNLLGMYEAKLSQTKADKNLKYFVDRYQIPATQIVYNLPREKTVEQIDVRRAETFLNELFL
ncbi:MAG: ATP-binding protein [Deltaproteobacteria bacterium]|nr:ATP-binding protein [Deltaproteobacteria bacterium]